MTIAEGAKNVLIGGHDEMTDKYYRVCDRIGYWKKEIIPTMELINSKTNGSIAGEGAAFFVLGNESGGTNYAKLRGIQTIYKPENNTEVENKISEFLKEKGLTANDIDVVVYGINGDARFDKTYTNLKNNYFSKSTSTYFKHLCGEYQTSGSFALWLAAMMLKKQTIPKAVLIGENNHKSIKNILIYNTFLDTDHSVYLLSQC